MYLNFRSLTIQKIPTFWAIVFDNSASRKEGQKTKVPTRTNAQNNCFLDLISVFVNINPLQLELDMSTS